MLIEGAVENHVKMIKYTFFFCFWNFFYFWVSFYLLDANEVFRSLKGVPGVIPERYLAAQKIQHCALSLVGEPILYPYINEFIDMLHEVLLRRTTEY